MKNLILGLFLFGFIATGHSQILLEEAKIEYRPVSMQLDPDTNSLELIIPEKKVGEFQQDPLAFMKANFDAKKFALDNKDADLVNFEVYFKSRKGFLVALFDEQGELISTNQKFKDVVLPEDARLEILRTNKNAVIKGTKYVAYSKGWDLNKEFYRVKISDGNKIQRLRINRDNNRLSIAQIQ